MLRLSFVPACDDDCFSAVCCIDLCFSSSFFIKDALRLSWIAQLTFQIKLNIVASVIRKFDNKLQRTQWNSLAGGLHRPFDTLAVGTLKSLVFDSIVCCKDIR